MRCVAMTASALVTPGARIAAAIDILAAIEAGQRPADDIAADYFRRRRYIGVKDRAQVAAPCLRRAAPPRGARLVDRARRQGRHRRRGAQPDDRRAADRRPGRARRGRSAELRRRPLPPRHARRRPKTGWRTRSPAAACAIRRCRARSPTTCRTGSNRISSAVFGDRLEERDGGAQRAGAVDLRVNLLKTDRDGARRALAAEQVRAEPTPNGRRSGLRLRERVPLVGPRRLQGRARRGAGRRLADSRRCSPARGPACGSSISAPAPAARRLALAAAMNNRGKLVACDTAAWRLERSASGCAAPGSAMSSAARSPASATNGSSATPRASTGCWSMRRASAPARGGATPTPNGAPRPNDLAELSSASTTSCTAPRGW